LTILLEMYMASNAWVSARPTVPLTMPAAVEGTTLVMISRTMELATSMSKRCMLKRRTADRSDNFCRWDPVSRVPGEGDCGWHACSGQCGVPSSGDSYSYAQHQVEEEQADADFDDVTEVSLGDGGGEAAASEGQKYRSPADYEIGFDHNQQCQGGDNGE
jgi:hypothetical protein